MDMDKDEREIKREREKRKKKKNKSMRNEQTNTGNSKWKNKKNNDKLSLTILKKVNEKECTGKKKKYQNDHNIKISSVQELGKEFVSSFDSQEGTTTF